MVLPKSNAAPMTPVESMNSLLAADQPLLALAPMQDVTDLPFWRVIHGLGGADLYVTEYFRVHATSKIDRTILRSIEENPTNRPVAAQMIGNDITELVRTARELQRYPIAAVDLNLGCPAPVVYRKCAGGGLLPDPDRVSAILGALRQAIQIRFTVKTRIGFDDPSVFDRLLDVFSSHQLDLLTVHGRTVKEGYRSEVHYDYIARAVQSMNCPVLANGNVYSADKALRVLAATGARGLMIGRGAIRNPWIFDQIRAVHRGQSASLPTGRAVLAYIRALYETACPAGSRHGEPARVQKMKKYMNYIGLGVEGTGGFLHRIRRARTETDFFGICENHLGHDHPMPLEPFDIALNPTDLLAGQHR